MMEVLVWVLLGTVKVEAEVLLQLVLMEVVRLVVLVVQVFLLQ